MAKKEQRGGARTGAGRKPAAYGETKMLRVPTGCMPEVLTMIRKFKNAFCERKGW